MKYKAVIFDMDGTVLNTIEDITDSVNYILGKYGIALRSVDEVKHFVGNGARVLMDKAIPEGEAHPLFEQILAEVEGQSPENFEKYNRLKRSLEQRMYEWEILSEQLEEIVES